MRLPRALRALADGFVDQGLILGVGQPLVGFLELEQRQEQNAVLIHKKVGSLYHRLISSAIISRICYCVIIIFAKIVAPDS